MKDNLILANTCIETGGDINIVDVNLLYNQVNLPQILLRLYIFSVVIKLVIAEPEFLFFHNSKSPKTGLISPSLT